jgi:alkyldihydroxyacetonephosphate synthase
MIDRETLRWNGWGWRAHKEPAEDAPALWSYLAETLGCGALPLEGPAELDERAFPPSRLTEDAREAFARAAPLTEAPGPRAFAARGRSYRDLLDLRALHFQPAPDAVVSPRTSAAVQAVIDAARDHDIAVVPFGGGTSVVGGVTPLDGWKQAVIALDTTRLTGILAIDRISMTATLQAGLYGPLLEQRLQEQGLTLGHFPQSFEFSTLGGWIAARGAGQQSNRYGKAEAWLVSARLATPSGPWATEGFPASAAGPRLTDLVAGSEGTLGLITDATVRVREKAKARDYRAWVFKGFEEGADVIRRIVQAGIPVSTLRLSDADETFFYGKLSRLVGGVKLKHRVEDVYLAFRGLSGSKCALIAGTEGDLDLVAYARNRMSEIAAASGGMPAGEGPALKWFAGRFHGPYLRDPMLDRGLGVDTLETAASWTDLMKVYHAVRRALAGAMATQATPSGSRGIVLAHISHSYPGGASLYFTYVWRRAADREAAITQWEAIKRAAGDAIAASGGTISHHHGIGTDHAPWMAGEKGPQGMSALRALKHALDPTGIMNPGKLGL